MKTPNENGVYEADAIEELARYKQAYAEIRLCHCDDGLYRYALDMSYSYGGFCGPISIHQAGCGSISAARDAGTSELLRRLPTARAGDPQSVHDELSEIKSQVECRFREPSLF